METRLRRLPSILLAAGLLAACDAVRTVDPPSDDQNRVPPAAAPAPASVTAQAAPLVPPQSAASGDRQRSRYTSLAAEDCRQIEVPDEETGMGGVTECPGVDGWRLRVSEGDVRMTVDAVTPAGKAFPLDLWSVVSTAFSSVGGKAEWRSAVIGGPPQALIVRFDANEDPERPERIMSYLVVSRLGNDGACAVAKIAPGANQNETARRAADTAQTAACLPGPQ